MSRTPAVITEPERNFNLAMGAWLTKERKRAELSMQILADRVGVCRQTIDNFEKGRTAMSVWAYKQLRRELEQANRMNILMRRRAA